MFPRHRPRVPSCLPMLTKVSKTFRMLNFLSDVWKMICIRQTNQSSKTLTVTLRQSHRASKRYLCTIQRGDDCLGDCSSYASLRQSQSVGDVQSRGAITMSIAARAMRQSAYDVVRTLIKTTIRRQGRLSGAHVCVKNTLTATSLLLTSTKCVSC